MEKLIIYDLNLEPFDDNEIKKEIFEPIIVDSSEEEEVEIDYNTKDSADYARAQYQDTIASLPSSKPHSIEDFKMTLRPRDGKKSLAYLDQRPDTPTDLDSNSDLDSVTVNTESIQDGCELTTDVTTVTDEDWNTKQIDIEEISMYSFNGEESKEDSEIDEFVNNKHETLLDYPQESLFIERNVSNTIKEFQVRKRKPSSTRHSYNRQRSRNKRRNKNHAKIERIRRKKQKFLFYALKNVIPNLLHQDNAPRILIIKESIALCKALSEEQSRLNIVKEEQTKINRLLREKLQNFVDYPQTVRIECDVSDTSLSFQSLETNHHKNKILQQKSRNFKHSYNSHSKSFYRTELEFENYDFICRKNMLFNMLKYMIPNLKGEVSKTLVLNESSALCKELSEKQSQLNMLKREQIETNMLLRKKLRDLIVDVVF